SSAGRFDHLPSRIDDEPHVSHSLALDVAGLLVGHVVVEGPTVVGDLGGAVVAGGGPQQSLVDAGARDLTLVPERGPGGGASVVARALSVGVVGEGIEGHPLRVDD